MADPIDPDHYNELQLQPIAVVRAWKKHWPAEAQYELGSVLKYVGRCGLKHDDPVEDLRKAQKFLSWAIEELESGAKSVPTVERPCFLCGVDRGALGYTCGKCEKTEWYEDLVEDALAARKAGSWK